MYIHIGITEILPERMRVQAHNLSYSACVFRGFLDGDIVQSQTCNVDTFGVDNVAWGAELHAEHRVRPSEPPWVNNSMYLCRVPAQQRCFDATRAEGCIGFCCFPCSILGATVEPEFLMYTVAASSRVLGAIYTRVMLCGRSACIPSALCVQICGQII